MSDVKTVQISEWTKLNKSFLKRKYDIDKIQKQDLDLINELDKKGKLSIRQLSDGIEIEAYSYVGIIVLSNFRVIIKPKIKGIKLARMISFAFNFDNLDLLKQKTEVNFDINLISDILAYLFIKEVEKIMLRGLAKRYQEKEENLSSPRGKIMFEKAAKNPNLGFTLPCRYQELTTDITENRLVLATLSELFKFVNSKLLKSKIKMYRAKLAVEVKKVPLTEYLLNKAKRDKNRLTENYNTLIELAEMILKSRDFNLSLGSNEINSFLLDMNLIFEKFLYQYFLKFNKYNYDIKYQKKLGNEFESNKESNHKLIPDYTIYRDNKIHKIADAKYKDYDYKRISREDLFQLTVYNLASIREVREVVLFYPSVLKTSENKFVFNINRSEEPIKIKVRGLNMKKMLKLDNLKSNEYEIKI